MTTDGDGATEAEVVAALAEGWCDQLGLGEPSDFRRLADGRSGSLVLSLQAGERRLVVKVTTEPERLDRAVLEARLLSTEWVAGLAPELIAWARRPEAVAIAIREGRPIGPASQLGRETWLRLATGSAALHRPAVGGLLSLRPVPAGLAAPEAWAALGAENAALDGARRLAEGRRSTLPVVLEHGDSHVDNVVDDHGRGLVWVDWQEAHLGDGLADLVFLWQRAEFAGARPPRAEMTAHYVQERSLSLDEVQELLDLAELRSLLHSWPPFLRHGSPSARDRMRRRLVALTS